MKSAGNSSSSFSSHFLLFFFSTARGMAIFLLPSVLVLPKALNFGRRKIGLIFREKRSADTCKVYINMEGHWLAVLLLG